MLAWLMGSAVPLIAIGLYQKSRAIGNGEPVSLYCSDETDGETFRACEQMAEALLTYEIGTTNIEPALAAEGIQAGHMALHARHAALAARPAAGPAAARRRTAYGAAHFH